ncbi:MAG TPA: helix-turn-helix domain-containing protein [Candidatus Aminicenantes bacterium]|nr:helix-turn-helix domain-containing protein [Candidatus Aminicenantes bacterium]
MTAKKITELAEQFETLTIKNQMKILAGRAVNSRYLFYKEIIEEFERTLLQALLEKYDHNVLKMSASVKLHRNTIAKKMRKLKMKERKAKTK